MLLEHFNEAAPDEVLAALRPCIDIERWAREIIAARPFSSVRELMEMAGNAASPFTADEVASAMAHHPRIGERAAGAGAEAELSRQEQSAVDPANEQIVRALAEGNRAYEAKFDQVFLIRAAGRSPQEIINTLHQRMDNTAEEENLIVAEQLREIALLRLEGVMSA
ncbi:2-oxo-4-hydroxy-4-carboxy-5-ureidoimidazoline decarboxylase [Arthrobacter dokdonensis]|uniref:2-oxo-4-hydroxy-4-carboxy-5-ureidoimidazoline decarboxylase n=1 Tax=Arthrobacter dokdonellae TaxID=2211210 RepID=UPI000DE5959A|nr:2-oxo-4-hydroxy-4-carboxy-5-ureidoimidazoline decarboxylase [Arthrobacter dokdonellae]